MTRGVEVTRGRKHDPSFHDLDDLSADEEVSHLYAMYLTDRLAASGSQSVRGNGFCGSLLSQSTEWARSNGPPAQRRGSSRCPSPSHNIEEHERLVDHWAERNPATVNQSDAAIARERLKMVRRSIERHGGP